MALDLADCSFFGPALPAPFVQLRMERLLRAHDLLPRERGADGRPLQDSWATYRRALRALGEAGGALQVADQVLLPLCQRLGYAQLSRQEPVTTPEGEEAGGFLCEAGAADSGSARLRVWSVDLDTDLDVPSRRGRAFRFSPNQAAHRVLLARGERLGLLTNGRELRLLLGELARRASHVAVHLDHAQGWRASPRVPDSFRLLQALASPDGARRLTGLIDAARLMQDAVIARLRVQARQAVEGFVTELLQHPQNRAALERQPPAARAATLWREGLVLVYRLLFIFKLESGPDPASAFSAAATSLWRGTYSPSAALAPWIGQVDDGGTRLADGLRALFRLFSQGFQSREMQVDRLGGLLFGEGATPLLDSLQWSERAVAQLLERLLWTERARHSGAAAAGREPIHYGSLAVEDLGRVYEALLELEPGISGEPMCRLRRDKLEVIVPLAQGAAYRRAAPTKAGAEPEQAGAAAGKRRVLWVEEIPAGTFFLRVGLGRKASGSYYTPHPFARFLVQETLDPQVRRLSPDDDPDPAALLKLKVLDPAMGSGHFLVEACRFLGDRLYEACRLCDELASEEAEAAARTMGSVACARHQERALALRRRLGELPDAAGELLACLPSRAPAGEAGGGSHGKALARARRLVAMHCLYGVDKNPLAVELAKLALWLESCAEGLALTFLDHRLVCGDSLSGPFFAQLLTYPGSGEPVTGRSGMDLPARLREVLRRALAPARELAGSAQADDPERPERSARQARAAALAPLRLLAGTWSGGVQLGEGSEQADGCDDAAYEALLIAVAEGRDAGPVLGAYPRLLQMAAAGRSAVSYDLTFPEVFYPDGDGEKGAGFSAVVGNPPWDAVQPRAKEFYAAFDLRVADAATRRERSAVEARLNADPRVLAAFQSYVGELESTRRLIGRLYRKVGRSAADAPSGAVLDVWQAFAERGLRMLHEGGRVGWVLPSAFHANQSSTGIRELYLTASALQCCYSFDNSKRLFDIHGSFKFAAVVAEKAEAGTRQFSCAFHLHDPAWLFSTAERLCYTFNLVRRTGGEYLSFLELRTKADAAISMLCFERADRFGPWCERRQLRFAVELDMSKSAHRFVATASLLEREDPRTAVPLSRLHAAGLAPVHEGKTFHQYEDRWDARPRYLIRLDQVAQKPGWLERARFYRLAFRAIASSTNERTGICALIPPGCFFGNSALCEKTPQLRPSSAALLLAALANSFPFDWLLRNKAGANINAFILKGCPLPPPTPAVEKFLAHAALRLTCNHPGYAALWSEQVGDCWREPAPHPCWPVLSGEQARWAVRSTLDAVVAQAYGLSRDQYAHVLAAFSHKSYRRAAGLCLDAFDELTQLGLEEFLRRHDPYWDIALNQSLPAPHW